MDSEDLKLALQVVDTVAKLTAFALGGWWTYMEFIRGPTRLPKADLQVSARSWAVSAEKRLVRVAVVLKNGGGVVLRPTGCRVWVQQIRPCPPRVLDCLEASAAPPAEETEYAWPLVGEKEVTWGDGECEVEPAETQVFDFDFAVPTQLETALVYAYVKNPAKRKREIGWSAQGALDLAATLGGGEDGSTTSTSRSSHLRRAADAAPAQEAATGAT